MQAMTVGKDVAMLFPDMMNAMQTEDLELKKLIYLYCQNYAKTQPDLAIMAVNTFVKDSQDPNPLIRALAVRTMGCIRVDKITEYLCDPLQRCLKASAGSQGRWRGRIRGAGGGEEWRGEESTRCINQMARPCVPCRGGRTCTRISCRFSH